MLNEQTMARVEAGYLQYLPTHFLNENFKWRAVQHFQRNWDIEAGDFAAMLERSLAKTYKLLASGRYFAKDAVIKLAKGDPEGMRTQFRILYDETLDLAERIAGFMAYAKERWKSYIDPNDSKKRQDFQDPKSISVYLWLRYPDKYYIYKYTEVADAAEILGSDFIPWRSSSPQNLTGTYRMFDEIHAHIAQNDKIIETIRILLSNAPDCYPDPQYRTLVFDVVFYISRFFREESWFPKNYNPGFTIEQWKEMLGNGEIFNATSLTIMERMLDIGGQATCEELADKYGEDACFYSSGSWELGERIANARNCPVLFPEFPCSKYWSVLYRGKPASDQNKGSYIWRLRDELKQALEETDLSWIPLYASDIQEDGKKEDDVNPSEQEPPSEIADSYTREAFLSEVFMAPDTLDRLEALVLRKKNVILQGAPGVGKTFAAKRLAWLLSGSKSTERIASVQFHQSYTYEDFIMGYKPDGADFRLQTGVFYDFCRQARQDPANRYIFLIDEINRGNLSKIFGELLQLIEADCRGEEILLAYNHEPFSVPKNLLLIGMMNTADRSIALIDYALRRRFSFFEMAPGFDTEGFRSYASQINDPAFNALVEQVKLLNREIADDPALGRGFRIGHSYLCLAEGQQYSREWLRSVVEYDLLPTLREYWFDNGEKVKSWEENLRRIFGE